MNNNRYITKGQSHGVRDKNKKYSTNKLNKMSSRNRKGEKFIEKGLAGQIEENRAGIDLS